jgi:hypothetical protein
MLGAPQDLSLFNNLEFLPARRNALRVAHGITARDAKCVVGAAVRIETQLVSSRANIVRVLRLAGAVGIG